MCPSLGSVSEVPTHGNFLAQNWNGPFQMLPETLDTPSSVLTMSTLTQLLLLALGNKWERWRNDLDECSWCEHQPLLPVVSSGD